MNHLPTPSIEIRHWHEPDNMFHKVEVKLGSRLVYNMLTDADVLMGRRFDIPHMEATARWLWSQDLVDMGFDPRGNVMGL